MNSTVVVVFRIWTTISWFCVCWWKGEFAVCMFLASKAQQQSIVRVIIIRFPLPRFLSLSLPSSISLSHSLPPFLSHTLTTIQVLLFTVMSVLKLLHFVQSYKTQQARGNLYLFFFNETVSLPPDLSRAVTPGNLWVLFCDATRESSVTRHFVTFRTHLSWKRGKLFGFLATKDSETLKTQTHRNHNF